MKVRFNFFTFIPAVIMWLICIYKFYADYDHYDVTDSLVHSVLVAIALAFSIFVLIGDHTQYKEEKRLLSFVPTGINVIFIMALLLTNYFLKEQDNTPTVMYGTTTGIPFNHISLDLRKNNTYKLGRHQFLSADYVRGRYRREDSIIYLENGTPAALVSNRLLLKTVPVPDSVVRSKKNSLLNLFSNSKTDTMPGFFMFQIDKDGKILDSAVYFELGVRLF